MLTELPRRSHSCVRVFDLALAAVLLAPLLGIALMERGAFGTDILQFGHENGATGAYLAHVLVFYVTYLLCRGGRRHRVARIYARETSLRGGLTRGSPAFLMVLVLLVNVALAWFVFFVVGASEVVARGVERGQFRANLGAFGALAYLARDFLTPALCALAAFVFRLGRHTWTDRLLLASNIVVAAASGAMWGFKSSMVFILVPTLIVLVPRVNITKSIAYAAAVLASWVVFAMFYEGYTPTQALTTVTVRATIGTGNTAWLIWDAQRSGEDFPPYWPTLTSALGGRLASYLGAYSRGDPERMYEVDYTAMVTLIAKGYRYDPEYATSNVTGTVFGEGVIVFGVPWFLVMSFFAAVVVSATRRAIDRAQSEQRPLQGAMAATFFLTSVFTWLNAGGVVTLIQLPFLANYALTYALARVLLEVSGCPIVGQRVLPGNRRGALEGRLAT